MDSPHIVRGEDREERMEILGEAIRIGFPVAFLLTMALLAAVLLPLTFGPSWIKQYEKPLLATIFVGFVAICMLVAYYAVRRARHKVKARLRGP